VRSLRQKNRSTVRIHSHAYNVTPAGFEPNLQTGARWWERGAAHAGLAPRCIAGPTKSTRPPRLTGGRQAAGLDPLTPPRRSDPIHRPSGRADFLFVSGRFHSNLRPVVARPSSVSDQTQPRVQESGSHPLRAGASFRRCGESHGVPLGYVRLAAMNEVYGGYSRRRPRHAPRSSIATCICARCRPR